MSLNFKYIDYGSSFSKYFWQECDKSEKNLYIFTDNRMKEIFSRNMGGEIFKKSPTFYTMEEFKEKIFLSDKLVLKEAKRILAFFKTIPKNIKEELGINTYYDVIDIANNFFAYYRELNINLATEPTEVPHWQKKYLNHFSEIKLSFDNLAQTYNYLPSDWLEAEEYFYTENIKNFSKVIFVDIIEFPKLYVKLLKELSKKLDIEIVLQMNKEDFDEENLKLKKVKIPDKIKNIDVYISKNDTETAFSLIYLKNILEIKGEIYSPAPEQNSYYKYFPAYFGRSQKFTMNDTKLYKFLNIQLDILNSFEDEIGSYSFLYFLKAFENKVFQEYYNISNKDFNLLNLASKEGYKYISKKLLKELWFEKNFPIELIEKLNEIFFDLDNIFKIQTSDDLYNYFKEQIKLENFIEIDFDIEDFFNKFFEIFGIIKSNEVMKIHQNLKEYFGNKIGISFYKLLIQYMKDLVIKSNITSNSDVSLIKAIDMIKYNEDNYYKVNYFIDINEEYLPKKNIDILFLTDKQKKELGIITREEKREIERYRFFQTIFNGKDSIIFAKKDEEKSIEISPFLEEIILKYKLEIKKVPINNEEALRIFQKLFINKPLNTQYLIENNFKKYRSDFIDNSLKLGAYDFETLSTCPLKFYFNNIKKLEHNTIYESGDIDKRFLGIIIHKILEKIVNNMWKDVLNNGFIELDYEDVKNKITLSFKEQRAKIPLHMDNYINEIMIPIFAKNIARFFALLKNIYKDISITRFQSEKSSFENTPFYSDEIDVFLTGRADLIIESPIGNKIIDYKTGGSQRGQLDFYSIILYGKENSCEKLIFNVWTGKIETEKKIELTREKLEECIKDFVNSEEYSRAQLKSPCGSCSYQNICLRGENI